MRSQQQGAALVGWFFLVVGLIGFLGATVESMHGEHPVTARVVSSAPLHGDETIVVTRVALPDGRVGVIESRDSFRVSSLVEVLWEGHDDAYETYAPLDRWIGSGVALGSGALLVGVSRATRKPTTPSGDDAGRNSGAEQGSGRP